MATGEKTPGESRPFLKSTVTHLLFFTQHKAHGICTSRLMEAFTAIGHLSVSKTDPVTRGRHAQIWESLS